MPLQPWVPELAALELLVSVAGHGSFGQAAREHGISQPAVSSRIRHLERRIGLPLVERSTTGSRLTPEGAIVVDWARSVLDAAGQMEAGVAALRRSRSGKLRVAASLTIAEYLVPGWLVAFAAARPEVSVSLAVGNSVDVANQVLAGDADVGFVEGPEVPGTLAATVVAHDRLELVVPPGHRWARRRRPVPVRELAGTPLVQRESGSGTRETYDRALAEVRLGAAEPMLVLSSTTAIKQAVARGVGPAVLSSLAVAEDLAAGRITVVPTAGVRLDRELVAVRPKGRQLVGSARDLVSIAKEA